MIELAIAQGVTLLGKIGYDVWKRWFDGPRPAAAMVAAGSTSLASTATGAQRMVEPWAVSMSPSVLTVALHPGDDFSLNRVFQELPVLLIVADLDRPDLDGVVVPGFVADTYEVMLPPGRYAVSAFVFDDDSLTALAGVAWEDHLAIDPGYDVNLSLGVMSGTDELAAAVLEQGAASIDFGRGEIFELTGAVVLLGRDRGCDLVIPDDSVSREHAYLGLTIDGWAIEDNFSRNGTFVNGTRVGTAFVDDGDIVELGTVAFQLRL